MIGNVEEAKDVLQDSFIDAFTKLNNLEHEVTFSAWLKRIVVNKCINSLRKNKNHFSSLEEEPELQVEAETGQVDEGVAKKGAQKILRALDNISEGCRTVFNLYLFEGYDHKEIGQILSISESASKAQYSKAKSKIRNLLEKRGE
jgi:RNA polymerase sigma-70 factor (ECF subfamily)